jgi:3,8-divinyl chlorophyllide a/chlorophyllide a reductase subunit Y
MDAPPVEAAENPPPLAASGDGGSAAMAARNHARGARAAGKSETLDRYAKDYPKGPHDQPQSMCPAFGSLRVGLRMRRTATILSGSACCVYGLTFTSHFYGARRTVGYVPFNSETLVTGKLFEDIRDAVTRLADPELYDAVVITNLCVPTASGVPLQLLPKEINGVRIIGIDVPGFGVPTHAEAKDVLAGAMLRYARTEAEPARCSAPQGRRAASRPSRCSARCSRPTRGHRAMLEPMGLAAGPSCRRANGASSTPRSTARRRRDPSVLHRQHPRVRSRRPPDRRLGAGRLDGTAAWLEAIGEARRAAARSTPPSRRACCRPSRRAGRKPIKGRITCRATKAPNCWSPACWSRAAPRCAMSAPPARAPLERPDREWLEAKGVHVQYRASLEQDLAAMREFQARPRHRHHAGGAEGEGARHPGALLHQPDLGAAADGPGRRRLARAGRQRAIGARRASTMSLLRRRRQGDTRRRLGRRARRPDPEFREQYKRRAQEGQGASGRRC